jgi:hypothetical protein
MLRRRTSGCGVCDDLTAAVEATRDDALMVTSARTLAVVRWQR